jgi:hypothetical protein
VSKSGSSELTLVIGSTACSLKGIKLVAAEWLSQVPL